MINPSMESQKERRARKAKRAKILSKDLPSEGQQVEDRSTLARFVFRSKNQLKVQSSDWTDPFVCGRVLL